MLSKQDNISLPLVSALVEILINILVVDQTSGRCLEGRKWKSVVDRVVSICLQDLNNPCITMTELATFIMYIVTILERSVSDKKMVTLSTLEDRQEWEANCLLCIGNFIVTGIRCEREADQESWMEIEELWKLCFNSK